MWKVKRMNTARIVVLTNAVGAGGVAAYLASGSDKGPAPAEPVAQMPTVDVLVAKSDIGPGQTLKPDDMVENLTDDQASKRGDSVSVVRYGVSSTTTMQK